MDQSPHKQVLDAFEGVGFFRHVLNTPTFRGRNVDTKTFAKQIAAVYDLANHRNAYYVRVFNELKGHVMKWDSRTGVHFLAEGKPDEPLPCSSEWYIGPQLRDPYDVD